MGRGKMMGRNTYPGLSGSDARKAIEAERKADEAFDQREAQGLASRERVSGVRKIMASERGRVKEIHARDQADRDQERHRSEAQQRVEQGDVSSLPDATIGPTAEWLQHGDVGSVITKQPENTVRVIKTVKRHKAQPARKQMLAGTIDYEGYMACCWYEDLHEETGLGGAVRSTDFTKEIRGGSGDTIPITEKQAEARETFRFVREQIPHKHLRLLDKMIISGLQLKPAIRAARAFHRRPKPEFRRAVEYLVDARAQLRDA